MSRKKNVDERVCPTISDDEELHHHQSAEESFHSDSNSLMSCDKEPIITDEMVSELKQSVSAGEFVGEGLDMEEMLDNSSVKQKTTLHCRTVRIGSYKVVPKDKVLITPYGIKVTVPIISTAPQKFVDLKILHHEIIKVLIHFGRAMPVLFFYTRPTADIRIRKLLQINDKNNYYYDSMSSDETHRRITFLPDKIVKDCKTILLDIYGDPDENMFAELTAKEANDILVKASPKEVVQRFYNKKKPAPVQQRQPFNRLNIQMQNVEEDTSQKEIIASQKGRKTKADGLTGESPKKKRLCRKKKEDEHAGEFVGDGLDMEEMLDNSSKEKKTTLHCRTVRIGSYKVVLKDKVLITPYGIKVTVPIISTEPQKIVDLKILHHEIIKVQIHSGRAMPVLFLYTRPTADVRIRKLLQMTDKNNYYYDSMSPDETHRRITFLPDKIDKNCKTILRDIYGGPDNNMFAELTAKEANDILFKASPIPRLFKHFSI